MLPSATPPPNQSTTKPRQMPSGGGATDTPGFTMPGGSQEPPSSLTPPMNGSGESTKAMAVYIQRLDPSVSPRTARRLARRVLGEYLSTEAIGYPHNSPGHSFNNTPDETLMNMIQPGRTMRQFEQTSPFLQRARTWDDKMHPGHHWRRYLDRRLQRQQAAPPDQQHVNAPPAQGPNVPVGPPAPPTPIDDGNPNDPPVDPNAGQRQRQRHPDIPGGHFLGTLDRR